MIRSRLAGQFVLSPNVEPRRNGRPVDMLVLHYTGMATAARALQWLCNPASGVSCHYLIDSDGAIVQMVGEEMRAWHAGASSWEGEADTNSRSIGIEIHNPGHMISYDPFPPAQMHAVTALCLDILGRHTIAPRRVLAHSDVAPGRKVDPGENFDWGLLYRHGIGHWTPPEDMDGGPRLVPGCEGIAVEDLQAMLVQYGYGAPRSGVYDVATETVVAAFQRHFRPQRCDGIADRSTVATLRALLQGL